MGDFVVERKQGRVKCSSTSGRVKPFCSWSFNYEYEPDNWLREVDITCPLCGSKTVMAIEASDDSV